MKEKTKYSNDHPAKWKNELRFICNIVTRIKLKRTITASCNGKLLLPLVVLTMLSTKIMAQDIHFSLFNEFPLHISPSFAGNSPSSKRAGLIYRNQWNSVSAPFQSSGFYGDLKLSPNFLNGSALGLGIVALNDRSGSGGLQQNHLYLMANYQKFIDSKQRKLIVAGIQLGGFQKGYDPNRLNFESEYSYENASFISNGNSTPTGKTSIFSPEIGLGASFTYFNKAGKGSTIGLAFAHLTTPEQSFLSASDPLKVKTTIHGKTVKRILDNLHFYPSILVMFQNKARSYVGGGEFVYSLGRRLLEQTDLKAGIYYRDADALFFTAGLNHDNWGINFGYDYNISELGEAAKNVNAFEIAISIRNRLFKKQQNKFIVPGNRLL